MDASNLEFSPLLDSARMNFDLFRKVSSSRSFGQSVTDVLLSSVFPRCSVELRHDVFACIGDDNLRQITMMRLDSNTNNSEERELSGVIRTFQKN